jgi:hypothetical protein
MPEANKSKTKNPTAQNEPWVLARHVEQCFFITDPSRPSRVVVRSGKRALVGMDGVADEQDFDGFVGDPMMEESDEDDATYTKRRSRTTLPRIVFRTQEGVTIWGSSIQQRQLRKTIHRDEDERDACKR